MHQKFIVNNRDIIVSVELKNELPVICIAVILYGKLLLYFLQ